MRSYPEWFVGGPWHGRDKMKECPDLRLYVRVAIPPRITLADLWDAAENTPAHPAPDYVEFIYVPRHASVFGERLTVWVGEGIAGELGHDSETSLLLGQLIMSPHRKDNGRDPYDVTGMAQRHTDRYEIEREVTRRIAAQHQNSISTLQREIERLTHQRTTHHGVTFSIVPEDGRDAAAHMVIRMKDGVRRDVMMTDITVYQDHGSDDATPGWIATAQYVNHGVTGFGESPLSAVYAMLGDAVGVYARVTELTNRSQ